MSEQASSRAPEPLLAPGAQWGMYESRHEVDKVVRRMQAFLLPVLARIGAQRVLEVGCGSGYGTVFLHEQGLDAWGLDPFFRDDIATVHPFLVKGSGLSIPFPPRSFDVSFALEVIEHIGTVDGFLALKPDYAMERRAFVAELCRVSKAWVIIATPNRRFPIDEHSSSRDGSAGFRLHSPFEHATLSAGDLEAMFREHGFQLQEFLDPGGYYALERIERKLGRLGLLASRTLLSLSRHRLFARSFMNPHLFLLFARDLRHR